MWLKHEALRASVPPKRVDDVTGTGAAMGRSSFPAAKAGATPSPKKRNKRAASTPSAAELSGAKVSGPKGSRTKDSNVHVWVLKYCTDGSAYDSMYEGALMALHLHHDWPNVFFLFLKSLTLFCESMKAKDPEYPGKWQDLCESMKIRISTTSPATGKRELSDEDNIGTFVKNRVCIYCEETNVKNVCCFLDGFIAWRVVTKVNDTDPEYEQSPEVKIHVGAASTLCFSASDAMECTIDVVKDVPSDHIDVFQAYPPAWPPRLVLADIESESDSTISIVFSGNTLSFATGFDEQGIGRKMHKAEGDEYGEWYRVCRGIDLAVAATKVWLLDLFGDKVLKSAPCVVRIKKFPKHDTEFQAFLQELDDLPNVRRTD